METELVYRLRSKIYQVSRGGYNKFDFSLYGATCLQPSVRNNLFYLFLLCWFAFWLICDLKFPPNENYVEWIHEVVVCYRVRVVYELISFCAWLALVILF